MKLLLQVLAVFALLVICAWLIQTSRWWWALLCVVPVIYLVLEWLTLLGKTENAVEEFLDSARYNDFSKHYNLQRAPADMQPLLARFNQINDIFKNISKTKTAENLYLQKILEMLDSGILSYKEVTGDIEWMNDAFRNLTGIPYAKNLSALQKRNKPLYQVVQRIRPGQPEVFTLKQDTGSVKVLINAALFQTDGVSSKLISFQNVNLALDENESKAWQKLLSVMTHEIMNSVAPISSLAGTLKTQLQQNDEVDKADLSLGLETIKKRSEGLQRFAETYRNLSKITKPSLRKIFVRELFENIQNLMQPTLDQKNIELTVLLKDPQVGIEADINLIEQVLINLLTNAMEAVKDKLQPHITLSAQSDSEKILIKVSDNGSGIPAEIAEQVFVPFFSTKKNGSGIGLSLCKQIMLLHKGTIRMQSETGTGTVFILEF